MPEKRCFDPALAYVQIRGDLRYGLHIIISAQKYNPPVFRERAKERADLTVQLRLFDRLLDVVVRRRTFRELVSQLYRDAGALCGVVFSASVKSKVSGDA